MARMPENVELSLPGVVTNPIKVHINGLGAFLFDHVIDDATCCTVICLEQGCWLGVPLFIQCCANGACSLGIKEECTEFCFSSTGNNLLHDLAQDVDGTIIWWHMISSHGSGVLMGAEEVVASCMGSVFGCQ